MIYVFTMYIVFFLIICEHELSIEHCWLLSHELWFPLLRKIVYENMRFFIQSVALPSDFWSELLTG
jgi:hypothetical protein